MSDYSVVSLIPIHETGITCAHVSGNLVATGSFDRTVRLTDLSTATTLLTLRGHKKAPRCVLIADDLIISGSNDHTLRIWNGRTGACIKELVGHKAPVTGLQMLEERYMMSGSQDSTIKLWDIDRGECVDTFLTAGPVECFAAAEDIVVVGAKGSHYNNTLFALDHHTGQRIRTFENPHWVKSIAFDGTKLMTGHYFPYVLKSWDVSTGRSHYELSGHRGAVASLQYQTNKQQLVSCAKEDNIYLWSMNTQTCTKVLDAQKFVSGVQCVDRRLVSWSEVYGSVTCWQQQQPIHAF